MASVTRVPRPPRRLSAAPVPRPRTAFVLGGGASLGAMQAGMLRALYEHDIVPDLIVATSAGALNAGFVASRPQAPETADQLGEVWHELRRDQIFPLSLRALLVGLSGHRDHLVPDHGLRQLIARHVEFADLADAAIPVHILAFDLSARSEVLFSQGPTVDTLTAAASIPGVFPPVRIGERSLVDGGVANNTPISHAVELGAERIFVMSTRESHRAPTRIPRGALGTAIDGLCQLSDGRLQFDLARYSNDVELIVLPAPNVDEVQPTDFSQAKRLIDESLSAARAFLAHGDAGHSRRRDLSLVNASVDAADELPSVA